MESSIRQTQIDKTLYARQIQSFISPFIDLSSLKKAQFPILPVTYSLWRKVCYQRLFQEIDSPSYQNDRICQYQSSQEGPSKSSKDKSNEIKWKLKKQFFQTSERKLLPLFIHKVRDEMDSRAIGWKKAILEEQQLRNANLQQYNELLLQYSNGLYLQQLYLQLFYDLTSIPYLPIYSEKTVYQPVSKYEQNSIYKKKNQSFADKMCNKFGKTVVSKGLGKLSQIALSRWMLFGVTKFIGGLNPLALAASFGISYLVESKQKSSKISEIVTQLKLLKEEINNNVRQLEETYQLCLCQLEGMLQLQLEERDIMARQIKKFKDESLGRVLVQDWLQINVQTDEEGWQVVEFHDKYSQIFQRIEQVEDSQLQNKEREAKK